MKTKMKIQPICETIPDTEQKNKKNPEHDCDMFKTALIIMLHTVVLFNIL